MCECLAFRADGGKCSGVGDRPRSRASGRTLAPALSGVDAESLPSWPSSCCGHASVSLLIQLARRLAQPAGLVGKFWNGPIIVSPLWVQGKLDRCLL